MSRAPSPTFPILTVLLLQGVATAATPIEIDAAVARVSSALYQTKHAAACGFPKNEEELKAAQRVAQVMALKKDNLDKSLSTDEYVTVQLRATDKDLNASMLERAEKESKAGACDNQELKGYWSALAGIAAALNKK